MFPDKSQPQPVDPASLPPVAMPLQVNQPLPVAPSASPLTAPAPSGAVANDPAHVIAQAKQLVLQYQHDPFRLSGALQQLKSGYLAEHHNIMINTAEN